MTTSNHHLSVPPSLHSESDPCSFSYKKADGLSHPSIGQATSTKKRPSKVRKIISSIKRALRPTPRPAFVMLHEYKPRVSTSRSSLRSRRSSAMTMTNKRISAPPVLVTGPTIKSRKSSYRVHSYGGDYSSPTTSVKESSVRFSHPTVKDVIKPPSLPTPTSIQTTAHDTADQCSIRSSGNTNVLTENHGSESTPVTPIRPKSIWRQSDQFKTPDGNIASFDEFKARFDGHKIQSGSVYLPYQMEKADDRPPSLQYIPRTSAIELDDHCQLPKSPDVESADIRKNRDEALRMLETGGVLAVMPHKDMPDSAVPVLSHQYPGTLTPSGYPPGFMPGLPRTDPSKQRPFSVPAAPPKNEFQAFDPRDFERFNAKVKYGYDPTPPTSKFRKGKEAADAHVQASLDCARLKTPDSFATLTQHRHHYDRVESGVFDSPLMPIERPANPTPPSSSSRSSGGAPEDIGRTFLEMPTPPQSPKIHPSLETLATRVKLTQHKSASSTNIDRKPVSSRPALRIDLPVNSDKVPTYHKMNDNGFPVANLREARTSFTAEPKYQRRSINDVEAKYLREHPVKKVKAPVPDKKVAKLEKEKAKLEKKIKQEQEKVAKKEKKKAEVLKKHPELLKQQQQLDEGVKKILNI